MMGPKEGNIPLITIHIAFLSCVAICAIFEAPFYWRNFSPCIPLLAFPFIVCDYACIILCELTEPGIILSNGLCIPTPRAQSILAPAARSQPVHDVPQGNCGREHS